MMMTPFYIVIGIGAVMITAILLVLVPLDFLSFAVC